ncbi:MAG: PadR family transcriptional regulator [Bradymonadales bacterium]|nr:MAG: PadR family transcriptional regulator [Bradymonadales bacterium]
MNAQFKKGILELCVLSLINRKDCYGYELVEEMSKTIDITEGSIYPILRRLTLDGYCETYLQESSGGPPRKYYRISKEGQKALRRLMKDWNEFISNVSRILK